jgi:predicted nicotinamide N-methyase
LNEPSAPVMRPDPASFIRGHTRLSPVPLVPELSLYTATEAVPLWEATESARGESGLAPPFWAFPWAGGQALARYVLDHPDLVAGRRVVDLAAGSGLVALAAAGAGAAAVLAIDVDALAIAAIGLNAAANALTVSSRRGDFATAPDDADVILAGDVFYSRQMAAEVTEFLDRAARRSAEIVIGDPGRAYLPRTRLIEVATYDVPVVRDLEDAAMKQSAVWRWRGTAGGIAAGAH